MIHLKRLCSVIDRTKLKYDLGVPPLSEGHFSQPKVAPCYLMLCDGNRVRVAVVYIIFFFDHRVVTVDPHAPVIMRHGKSQDRPVNLLTLDMSEHLTDGIH